MVDNKNKSLESLPEVRIERDISSFLDKVADAVFATFEKYKIPPNPLTSWGLLSQASAPEFYKRMKEIQEQYHKKNIPLPMDLIQAQSIVRLITRADKSLAMKDCEGLAYQIGLIVEHLGWPRRYQPTLAGRKKLGKESLLTLGIIQLVQYAENSPTEYTAEEMLGLIDIFEDYEIYDDLNRLELEPVEKDTETYRYKIGDKERTIGKRSLINAIYRQRKKIRNPNTS